MHAECGKIAARAASDNVDQLGILLQLTELELIGQERKSAEQRLKACALVTILVTTALKPLPIALES